MDFFAEDDYFRRESQARALLVEVKAESQLSAESVAKVAKYINLLKTKKNYMEEAINHIGEETFACITKLAAKIDFSKVSDETCTEIFAFYSFLLLNNHIDVIKTWVAECFSPLLWLSLSKLYLKNLFTAYPKFIAEYEAVIKQKPDQDKLQAACLLNRCLSYFGEKLASLSFDLKLSELHLCEKMLEFLVVCVCTPQSRLATIQIMQDRQFYIKNKMFLRYLIVKYSESRQDKQLANLIALMSLLKRFVNFDIMGESRIAKRTILVHYDTFQEFQKLLFHHFSEKVEHYVIKSVGSADTREKLMEIFSYLDEQDLRLIANKLNIFVPEDQADDPVLSILTEEKGFKVIIEEILIFKLKSRKSMLERIKSLPLYPTQNDLWSPDTSRLQPSASLENLHESFAVDRVTTSFINLEDYLIRYFYMWKQAFSLDVRTLVDAVILKLHPTFEYTTGQVTEFGGWSPNSAEIKEFTIYEVEKPQIGKQVPEHVLAEVIYSTVDINMATKAAWERLRAKESLFLLSFKKNPALAGKMINELDESKEAKDVRTQYHVSQVRGCELLNHMDEDRNKINVTDFRTEKDIKPKGTKRYLQMHLDPYQYSMDMKGEQGSWTARNATFNVVVKRHVGSPNFKAYLELIVKFLEHSLELPDWLLAAVVGKTFNKEAYLNRHAFTEALDVTKLFSDSSDMQSFFEKNNWLNEFRHLFIESSDSLSYRPPDSKRLISQQKEACVVASLPGVTLIDGAPSSGKMIVAAEIAAQSLVNNPDERVLIVTRSAACVSKVLALLANTIPEDKLIRLDSGATAKDTQKDFTRFGRVNYVLKRRLELLEEAEQIAADVGLSLHSQLTCETAEILFKSQIQSRWTQFQDDVTKNSRKEKTTLPSYPFRKRSII